MSLLPEFNKLSTNLVSRSRPSSRPTSASRSRPGTQRSQSSNGSRPNTSRSNYSNGNTTSNDARPKFSTALHSTTNVSLRLRTAKNQSDFSQGEYKSPQVAPSRILENQKDLGKKDFVKYFRLPSRDEEMATGKPAPLLHAAARPPSGLRPPRVRSVSPTPRSTPFSSDPTKGSPLVRPIIDQSPHSQAA